MKLIALTLALLLGSGAYAGDCPSKPQNIKVIDLKSGWWQGDGADTDQYVIKLIETRCPNVKFFYEHTLYGSGFSFAPKPRPNTPSPTTFDQVWLLSGGEADGADLRITDPKFLEYQKLMVDGNANLFIGTGFGNVYHANAVTEQLGLGKLLLTDREVHEYPSPTSGVTMVNQIPVVVHHPLFDGINMLPNLTKIGDFEATPDRLNSSVQALAFNDGKIVIGEVKIHQRTLIIDANLARTYHVRDHNPVIEKYLLNLVKVLEN